MTELVESLFEPSDLGKHQIGVAAGLGKTQPEENSPMEEKANSKEIN